MAAIGGFKELKEEIGRMIENYERAEEMRKGNEGKFKVIGVDKFSYEDFSAGEYDTAAEAITAAEEMTNEAKNHCTDSSIATVYYAYDPNGRYLGGDTWKDNEKGRLFQK